MRRTDKEIIDPAALDAVLDAVEWGTLGLAGAEGLPVLVPVNFVRCGDRLSFHGATTGEKMARLQVSGAATFLVVEPYALIPSYASSDARACPATQFYKSVLLYGQVEVVTDRARKAGLLQALMEKLQPEGGHLPITDADPQYRAGLDGVAVLEMTVARRSGKFAFGQMFSADRGTALDLASLAAMAAYGPA